MGAPLPSSVATEPWVPPTPALVETAAGAAAGAWAAMGAPVLVRLVRKGLGPLGVSRDGHLRAADTNGNGHGVVTDAGDPGWFGPDSVTWRVHADTSMLVAGMTAFALQTLHPRAMAGVWDHSAFGGDFFGRTRRTGEFVQGVVYDPSAAAERRCAALRRIHDRVVGHTPDGRPYSAGDTDLLEWVHVTEYLALASANRRFAAHPMSRAELDTYVAEVARVGSAVGVVDPPRSWAELDAAFRRHAPDLAVGEQAATAVHYLENPPFLPAVARPAWRAVWAGALACLPPLGRTLLRTSEPPLPEVAACRALVRAVGRLLGEPLPLRQARRRLA
ncbi:MAG TPA: oxygenase MpaB family protein [Acidimicrobiia bacterium]|nr:oxygenase MpaB family protein [Acidimicrobiia bacterium]